MAKGRQRSLSPAVEKEIVAAFQAGTPAAELARQYEKSNGHIYALLHRAGLRPGLHWKPGPHRDLVLERKVVEKYLAGPPGSARGLSKKFGISYATVLKILERHNVEVRHPKIEQATLDRIADLRRSGASQMAIAKATGVSQPQVSRVLNTLGFDPAPHRSGEKHGAWKGGRFVVKGYVRVWLPREHPFFEAMALHDGYVFEHRLVMAETLGRPLLPTEGVHHIDGNRLNNAPSNLQLRHGNHGKGVVLRCRQCGSNDIETIDID